MWRWQPAVPPILRFELVPEYDRMRAFAGFSNSAEVPDVQVDLASILGSLARKAICDYSGQQSYARSPTTVRFVERANTAIFTGLSIHGKSGISAAADLLDAQLISPRLLSMSPAQIAASGLVVETADLVALSKSPLLPPRVLDARPAMRIAAEKLGNLLGIDAGKYPSDRPYEAP